MSDLDHLWVQYVDVHYGNMLRRATAADLPGSSRWYAEALEMGGRLEEARRQVRHLQAELADLRASSVVVRERCQTCDGEGVTEIWDAPTPGDGPRCPDCDNGWRLAEGVIPVVRSGMPDRWYHSFTDYADGYVIPARLVEDNISSGLQ